jgi:SAM-dependent methyltransferase
MSIFRWSAPIFKLWGKRWSEDDFRVIAARLRPHVPSGGVIADLGGGTGDLGAGVAHELDARVVIIDATPQMLRRVAPRSWVSVRRSLAEALPFPDAYFDALICCDAFHHFSNQHRATREIARVVRPGGGVLILDMDPEGRDRFWVVLERLLGEPALFMAPEELRLLFASHGIDGMSKHEHGSGYSFTGTVGALSPEDPIR